MPIRARPPWSSPKDQHACRPHAPLAVLPAMPLLPQMPPCPMIRICAAGDVADALTGPLKDAVDDTNARVGGALRIERDPALAPGQFEIKGA